MSKWSSVIVVGAVVLTMTSCVGAPKNTQACREILNVEGELSTLLNATSSHDGDLAEVLPRYGALAEQARAVDADGTVADVAASLADVAQESHDALDAMMQDSTLRGPLDASILEAYIDASVDMRGACDEFLP